MMKGTLFGRLTTKFETTAAVGGRPAEGWVCTCSCGNRTFRTTNELFRQFSPSCGCDSNDPMPDRVFTRSNLPTWGFCPPILRTKDADARIGETWGTLTIVDVHDGRIDVACSACSRVKAMPISQWGLRNCSCRASQVIPSASAFLEKTFGRLTIIALSLPGRGTGWKFNLRCECGSRFSLPVSKVLSLVEKSASHQMCPACIIELTGTNERSEKWRRIHGGTSTSHFASYRIAGAHYNDHGGRAVSKPKSERTAHNLAPRGLTGSDIPRFLIRKLWEQMQSSEVCTAWRDLEKFTFWARNNGYVLGAELVRIDESKPFHPNNVRWIADRSSPSNAKFRSAQTKKFLSV